MVLLFYVCLLDSVATVRHLLCSNEHLLPSCFFSVMFASLSAADSEADGDGKKRATFILTCL